MKTLLIAFVLLFAPLVANATCPSYPFTLTNGQTADANQVMANFNSIAACVNNIGGFANAPVNTNITSITALTTPLSVVQGGTGSTTGSTALITLGGLSASNNLSDLTSITTARTNLGLGGAAVLSVGTTAGTVAAGNDSRFSGPTQKSVACPYTLKIGDAGTEILVSSGSCALTIPANASIAYAVGTKVEIVNDCGSGTMTLAITSDTLEWFPSGTTGTRTLAACSIAQLTKIGTTKWVLTGVGIT